MTCAHHLDDDPNGLRCVLEDHPDHPNGHSYTSTSGVPRALKEEA